MMQELIPVLGTTLIVTLSCMFILWLISIPLKNASIVDIFWGPGFGIIAAVTWFLADGTEARRTLLTVLTVLWALRLGLSAQECSKGYRAARFEDEMQFLECKMHRRNRLLVGHRHRSCYDTPENRKCQTPRCGS